MSDLPSQSLPLAVHLYRHIDIVEEEEGSFRGRIPESWNEQHVRASLEDHGLLGFGPSFGRLVTATTAGIGGYFTRDMQGLLAPKPHLHTPPEAFYISEIDYLHPDESERLPAIVEHYFDAAEVACLLRGVADYSHTSTDGGLVLVFIHQTKLEHSVEYELHDLVSLGDSKAWMREFLIGEGHETQKRLFVQAALVEMFKGHRVAKLGSLLPRLRELTNLIEENFRLYVADFSLRKMKDELRQQKLDFIQKLNGAFSSIQNQLLAVPAALLLAGTQLQASDGPNAKNMLIFAGYVVFAAFMALMVRNQVSTVDAINAQIEEQRIQMAREYPQLTETLRAAFDDLDKQYRRQRRALSIVDGLIALSLFVVAATVLWEPFVSIGASALQILGR
jgi:hypothetical protein